MRSSSLTNNPKLAFDKVPAGIYEGTVEYTADPMNLGRIKVRVAGVNNSSKVTDETKDLPWASPCFMPGAFSPPEVGDSVIIVFMHNDANRPYYLGVFYNIRGEEKVKGRLAKFDNPGHKNQDFVEVNAKQTGVAEVGPITQPTGTVLNDIIYNQPYGNTSPEESFLKRTTQEPEVRVITKTKRGHTIYAIDEAEKEKFKIIDRFGQALSFECAAVNTLLGEPVDKYNMQRRGTRDVTEDGSSAVPLRYAVNLTTRVILMDAKGQGIRMTASDIPGMSKVEILGLFGAAINFSDLNGGSIELKSPQGSILNLGESATMSDSLGGSVKCIGGKVYLN